MQVDQFPDLLIGDIPAPAVSVRRPLSPPVRPPNVAPSVATIDGVDGIGPDDRDFPCSILLQPSGSFEYRDEFGLAAVGTYQTAAMAGNLGTVAHNEHTPSASSLGRVIGAIHIEVKLSWYGWSGVYQRNDLSKG